MLLNVLPPDRNIAASMAALPVVKLLLLPGMQTYWLERRLNPRLAQHGVQTPARLDWSLVERFLLSPTSQTGVSLLLAAALWLASLPVRFWWALVLMLLVVFACFGESFQLPLSVGEAWSGKSECRMQRPVRPRLEIAVFNLVA